MKCAVPCTNNVICKLSLSTMCNLKPGALCGARQSKARLRVIAVFTVEMKA